MGEVQSESVRALVMTPEREVLLMRIAGVRVPSLWIAPGGRREAGETAQETLRRELREELGLKVDRVGPELWMWRNALGGDATIVELERMFLVEASRFEPSTERMETAERSVLKEFRWWNAEAIVRSDEMFVPLELGVLTAELLRDGPARAVRNVKGVRLE